MQKFVHSETKSCNFDVSGQNIKVWISIGIQLIIKPKHKIQLDKWKLMNKDKIS